MADPGVSVVNPQSGAVEQVAPADAGSLFLSGQRGLLPGQAIPLAAPDGTVGDFPADKVEEALRGGFAFASRDQVLAADAEHQPLQAFGEGALSALTFGTSDAALHAAGVEGLRQRQETTAHGVGTAVGLGATLLIPGIGEATAASELGARAVMKGALEAALAPTRLLQAAGDAVEHAGSSALGSIVGSQVGRQAVAGALGRGVEGAAIGSLQAISEESLGNPDVNAEHLLAAGLMGGLLGGGIGAVPGGIVGAFAGRSARLAELSAAQLGEHLEAAGVAGARDNTLVDRALRYIREELPSKAIGADVADIRAANTPEAQAWMRTGKQTVEETTRALTDVLDRMAGEQSEAGAAIARAKPALLKSLAERTNGNEAVGHTAATLTETRAALDEIEATYGAVGLGADKGASALKPLRDALDAVEAKIFESAGVAQRYEERLVHEHPFNEVAGTFERAGRPQEPGVALPEPSLEGQLKASVAANERAPVAPGPGASEEEQRAFRVANARYAKRLRDTPLAGGQQELPLFPQNEFQMREDYRAPATEGYISGAEQVSPRVVTELDAKANAAADAFSKEEQRTTGFWRGSGYRAIRAADKEGGTGEAAKALTHLNQMIEAHGIEAPVLYRGISAVDRADLQKILSPGAAIEDSISSWSYNPAVAAGFAGTGEKGIPVVFRVANAKGLPIGHFESELVLPKQRWEVDSFARDDAGRYTVLLRPQGAGGQAATQGAASAGQTTFEDLAGRSVSRMVEEPLGSAAARGGGVSTASPYGPRQTAEAVTKSRTLDDLANRYALPGKVSGAAYEGLAQMRSVLERAVRKARTPELAEALQAAHRRVADGLESTRVWGEAGRTAESLNTAQRARDDAWTQLTKFFRVLPDGSIDPASVSAYARKLGLTKGDAAVSALEQWHAAQGIVAGAAEQSFVGTRGFAAANRTLSSDFVRTRDVLERKMAVFNALDRLASDARKNRLGLASGSLSYALGSVAGVHGVLPAIGIAAMMTSVLDPGRAAMIRANTAEVRNAIGAHVAAAVKSIANGADAIATSPHTARGISRATMAMIDAKNERERQDAFRERQGELMALADPRAFAANAESVTAGMSGPLPAHTTAVQGAGAAALNYLLGVMPGTGAPVAGGIRGSFAQPLAPLGAAILRFAYADLAAQHPMSVLEHAAKHKTVLPAQAAALAAVYPNLSTMIQSHVQDQLAGMGKPPTEATARVLTSLLGSGPDGAYLLDAQAVHAPQAEPAGQQGRGTQRQPSADMSDAQRLEQ